MEGQGPEFGPIRLLIVSWICAVALFGGPVRAQAAPQDSPDSQGSAALVVPSPSDVEKLAQSISEDTQVDEQAKQAAADSLQEILEELNQIAATKERHASLLSDADNAAAATKKAKAALEKSEPAPSIQVSDWQPVEQVRAQQTKAESELSTAREGRARLESQIRDRDVRRAELESIILATSAKLDELESQPPYEPAEGEDRRVSRVKRWSQATEIALTRETLRTLQQEQQTYAAEAELVPAQLEIAKRDVAAKEILAQQWARAVAERRDTKVTSDLAAFRTQFGSTLDRDEVGVLDYEKTWLDIVRETAEIKRNQAAVTSEVERYHKDYEDRKVEVEKDLETTNGLRSSLGLKLQRLRSRLPDLREIDREISALQIKIDAAQVTQSEIEERIEELSGENLLGQKSSSASMSAAATAETELLRQMTTDVSEYWGELLELKTLKEDLYETVRKFENLIDRNVLWIRSARPYELSDLPVAWQAFRELLHPRNLRALWEAVKSDCLNRPTMWVLPIALIGILFASGARQRRRLAACGDEAKRGGQTNMQPTWVTLILTFLLAAPLILLFMIPGWRISGVAGSIPYVQAVGHAFMETAAFILPLEVLRQVCRPRGLAVSHFGWSDSTTRTIRTNLRFLLDLGIPLVIVWAVTESLGNSKIQALLGRLVFAALMFLIAGVIWSTLHPRKGIPSAWIIKHPGGWIDQLKVLWHPAATSLPVWMGVLCLAGYSYSTRALSIQLYHTTWLMLSLMIASGVLNRWLLTNRRRMLLAQMQQRAAEREKQKDPAASFVEDQDVDVTQVNIQTRRLINAFLIAFAVVGLAWIWSSVLPAVEYLERITLFPGEPGQPPLLTLANLVVALPIAVLTVIASRNLPGLLESVILQKLPLDNAARYAITTLASYALIVVGVMMTANTLGLRWDSIQWLVAALGVGLGFGLQEIFANFISGIILLFEQPIRVGDVVTLGDTTGVVSRIRIRATTITNWDRQELIIPNKDLITGRLVNWTLSDSTNRIVINVGIAYGDDPRKACALLEQICQENENIAEDPTPLVTFEGFGDSTLNLVVRCYMSTLDGRLGTIHDLHNAINDRFAEADIEIAFPQRDLHIRSLPPDLTEKIAGRESAA